MIWALAILAGAYSVSMLYLMREVQLSDIEYEDSMKYLSRPTEIDAMQWPSKDEPGRFAFFVWMGEHCVEDDYVWREDELHIQTAHDGQWVLVKPGDFVVREEQRGRFYPVKEDVFKAKYRPVPAEGS